MKKKMKKKPASSQKIVLDAGSSVQGNSDYVTKFELQHGLLEDDLLTYSETVTRLSIIQIILSSVHNLCYPFF